MTPKTVLVIDDEAHVRMLYAEELRQKGYRVIDAEGGDVLALVEKHNPDLIILDIKLRNQSGLDILQQVRSRHPVLPIILNTAYDSFRFDLKAIVADAYVVKSYDTSELMRTVSELAGP